MARPSSANTRAAASRADTFFALGSAAALRWRFGLAGIAAVASAVPAEVWSAAAASVMLGWGAGASGAWTIGGVVNMALAAAWASPSVTAVTVPITFR